MSKDLIFGNTPVTIPTSSEAPDWSQGVTDAFTAIAETLDTVAGIFDVPSQSQDISTSNPGIPNTNITNLTFPIASVRAVDVTYAVFRTTSGVGATTLYETGHIQAIYSPSNPTNSKWEMSQDRVGDAGIVFNITDLGQFQFTASTITGSTQIAKVTFLAKAILQT